MKTLKPTFVALVSQYPSGELNAEMLWIEIENAYSQRKRHYHTLSHLLNLYDQLRSCKHLIKDWNVILFSLYYHDIVYNASKRNNEEKSAALAEKQLQLIGVPQEQVAKCVEKILATKSHQPGTDSDTDLFTDADLSVLGMDWKIYHDYFEQVRKEYSIYPDLLYKPGRKKVLEHFLTMERIFKSDFFFEKYEQQARINLAKEIQLL